MIQRTLNRTRMPVVIGLAAVALWVQPARATELSGVQNGALDLPRINAIVRTSPGATPQQGTGLVFDPIEILAEVDTYNIEAFFDTGASNTLFATSIADPAEFNIPIEPNWIYEDVGVGGTASFAITGELYIDLAPYAPDTVYDDNPTFVSYTQSYGPVRGAVGPVNIPPGVDPVTQGLQDFLDDIFGGSGDPIEDLIAQLTEFNIIGMPLMKDKTVVMNGASINEFVETGFDLINLDLETLPAIYTHVLDSPNAGVSESLEGPIVGEGIPYLDRHIRLGYATFDDFVRTIGPPEAVPPTLAHNPFVGTPSDLVREPGSADDVPGVTLGLGGLETNGNFLLDTGGSVTAISTEIAGQLNVRYKAGMEPGTANPQLEWFNPDTQMWEDIVDQFELTITGVGGDITAAGFNLDTFLVRTLEGNALNKNDPRHIRYNGVPVLVFDIQAQEADPPMGEEPEVFTLDGIFGMNLLFASIFVDEPYDLLDVLGFPMSKGAFDWVVFDEPSGTLGLAYDTSLFLTADFNFDDVVDLYDYNILSANMGLASGAAFGQGDADGDGDVDFEDFVILSLNFAPGPPTLPGDIDLDGDVDLDDYNILSAAYGTESGASLYDGDLDGDGDVDFEDFVFLALHFGDTAGETLNNTVPEPAILTGLAAMMVLLYRRRDASC